jgi:threonine/homoserine/homoserine lactone efflux protein
MDLSALLLFAAALFVNAGSPGPGITALVARVIGDGFRSVLPFLLAFWLGELLWLVAAVLGLSALAEASGAAFLLLRWAGVAYLLWLAWKLWTRPPAAPEDLPLGESGWGIFLAGLALTLSNPKIMVFYLALLPSLIDMGSVTALGLLELCAVALLVMMAVDLGWAGAAAWARRWLRTPRAVRLANRVGATAMGGAALVIATR